MRGVFRSARVVAFAFAVTLLAANAASATTPAEDEKGWIDRIIVWLEGRISIPPGNS